MATLLGIHLGHHPEDTVDLSVREHAMEHWISYVLRAGVIVSAVIILIGGAMFILRGPGPSDPNSMKQLLDGNYVNRDSLSSIFRGLRRGRGTAFADVGLLVLIATPVIRVAMTALLFTLQKDWVFVVITSLVFVILVLGVTDTAF